MRTARAGHIEDCPAMPGPRDKRHRTRRSALLKRTTGIPIRHRGGRTPGDARLNCGPASRIARPLHHHGRCRTNLKRRQAHNAGDQRLATKGLFTPTDFIASPLHRLVSPLSRVSATMRWLQESTQMRPAHRRKSRHRKHREQSQNQPARCFSKG